jgi:hypothetical protein
VLDALWRKRLVLRRPHRLSIYLEPVINFRAGSVLPQHMRAGDPIARENRARRGGGRRLWRPHRRVRQRSMAQFSPQPEGLGQSPPAKLHPEIATIPEPDGETAARDRI